jgi:hypothetical protein
MKGIGTHALASLNKKAPPAGGAVGDNNELTTLSMDDDFWETTANEY